MLNKRYGLSGEPDAVHLNCRLSPDTQNENVVILDFQNNWAGLAQAMSFDHIYVLISEGRVNGAYGSQPGDENTKYRLALSKGVWR